MSTIPSMDEQFTKKLRKIIEDNFTNDQFCVTMLANEMNMSRATLHRKIKTITGQTVSQFTNEVRLKAAKQLLLNRSGTVSEIAYMVGFGSSNYFIKCFHTYYGYPPGKLLNGKTKKTETLISREKAKKRISTLYYKIAAFVLFMALFVFAGAKFFAPEITKNKKEQEKVLSTNQAALNLYHQGLKLMEVYRGSISEEHFLEAKTKFEEAIQLDSTFGDAYVQVANIFFSHIPFSSKTNKGQNYSDLGRACLDRAEHFGVLDEEYFLKTFKNYHLRRGEYDEAFEIFEKLWENKNKDYTYYLERGNYGFHARNYTDGIAYTLKYLQLKPDSILPIYDRLQKLALLLSRSGFESEAYEFARHSLYLYHDTIKYNGLYSQISLASGNFDKVAEYCKNAITEDNQGHIIYSSYKKLFEIYLLSGQHNQSLSLLNQYVEFCQDTYNKSIPLYTSGYYHSQRGETELAEFHFNREIQRWENFCAKNRHQQSMQNYCTIAACYSMLNDKQGLIQSLEKLYHKTSIPNLVVLHLQRSPMFDNFRFDKDFIELKTQIESKFYKERDTIEKLVNDFNLEYTSPMEKPVLLSYLRNRNN